MYLDLEDDKPDTPHLPEAFSTREGVLASLLVHALLVIAYLLRPAISPEQAAAAAALQPQRDPGQFVHMVPGADREAPRKGVRRRHAGKGRGRQDRETGRSGERHGAAQHVDAGPRSGVQG